MTTEPTITKTSAARIQVGDVIDFNQHKGANQTYTDTPDLPVAEWHRVSGVLTVVDVKRVVISHRNAHRKETAIQITFDNGRMMEAMGVSKFPVVTA